LTDPVYIYFHIPRTGGTSFGSYLGNYLSRDEDQHLIHYNTDDTEGNDYFEYCIPLLCFRTIEQHKKIKFLTGHKTVCNSHYWLKTHREPRFISFVRNPIERLLSSYNYKREISLLIQNPQSFTRIWPQSDNNPRFHQKTADEYDTLYEWYLDNTKEQNTQSKWLINAFFEYNDGEISFIPSMDYRHRDFVRENFWPEYLDSMAFDDNLLERLESTLQEYMFIITDSSKIKEVALALTKNAGTKFYDKGEWHPTGVKMEKRWTVEDVEKQPDYKKLVDAEYADFRIWNRFKNRRLPL